MKKNGFIKVFLALIIMSLATSVYAKSDVEVRDILFGSYSEYYNTNKSNIVDVYSFNYYDWVGKSYAKDNNIDENKMLDRARDSAKDFSIGYSGSYLPGVFGKNYDSNKYYILVDNYKVTFIESDYKYSTITSGNIIIFKK